MSDEHQSAEARLKLRDGLMIVWRKECYRSSATSRTFDIPIHYVWYDYGRSRLGIIRRYVHSFFVTMGIIAREKPKAIVAINLPPPLLVALLLGRIVNSHAIILDFHSGALTNPTWRPFLPLYRWLVRTAPFTVNHNHHDGKVITSWGGRPVPLVLLPRVFEGIERQDAPKEPQILAVCSFAPDEPVELLFDAMALCPQVRFAISGNYKRAGISPGSAPANVKLLGFLDYQAYLRLMACSTAIITLSDRPNIMQMAVHEAVSLGVPVVTNISDTLEGVLEDAGIYCELRADSLASGITRAVDENVRLRRTARSLMRRRRATVQRELDKLRLQHPTMFGNAT